MTKNSQNSSENQDFQEVENSLKSCKSDDSLPFDLTLVIPQIQQVLADLQPYVASHGGHIEFVEVRDFVVFIRLSGACQSCPLSFYTLTYGIERHIKAKIPSILRVEALEL